MNKTTTITSGPWASVYNSSDTSEAYKDKLYAAQNMYKDGNSWPTRPPFVVTQAAGTLGQALSRYGAGMYEHMGIDGTSYRFVFCGKKMYRWDGNTTYTDVTPAGVTFSDTARVFCSSFADKLIVQNGADKPFFVASSGCSATPLVATKIEIDSTPSAWVAWGPPAVWDGRLWFIISVLAGVFTRNTIVWSEVANPATGYRQTDFANYWELTQTDPNRLFALAPTEISLVVFRAQSILNITGKTSADFATNATTESIRGVGTTTPASVVVKNGTVWFLDEQGRQYRYTPGSTPEPLWTQMADTVSAKLLAGFGGVTLANAPNCGIACYHADLDLVLSTSYGFGITALGANQIHVFDATTGSYYGTWDVDGLKVIHSIAVLRTGQANLSLCILGENSSTALFNSWQGSTSGQMWRQYALAEMTGSVSWADPSGPSASVTTHHLGRNEGNEWIFDRLTLRALGTVSAGTSGRTASLTYYTPRGNSGALTAIMGLYTTTPLTGVETWSFGTEVGAIWGVGTNARGPWLMAKVSGPPTAQSVPPFTPISVQLRGRAVPANPYIGVGSTPSLDELSALLAGIGGSAMLAAYSVSYNVTQSGGTVSGWDDMRGSGGYGPSLTSSGTAKPAWDGTNSLITFDGSNDELCSADVALFDLSLAKSIVVVGAFPSAGSTVDPLALSNAATNATLALRQASGGSATFLAQDNGGGFATVDSGVVIGTTRRLVIVSQDGAGGFAIDVPNTARASATTGATTSTNTALALGTYRTAQNPHAACTLRAVIILNRQVTTDDITFFKTWAVNYHAAVLV